MPTTLPPEGTETEILEFERKGKVIPGYNQSKVPGDLLSVAPHETTALNTSNIEIVGYNPAQRHNGLF